MERQNVTERVVYRQEGLSLLKLTVLADSSADKAAWLAARRECITASDIGALMGEHSYLKENNRETVIQTKAGQRPEFTGNRRTRIGLISEPTIHRVMVEEDGMDVRECGVLVQDPACSRLAATPDFIEAEVRWEGAQHVARYVNVQAKTHGGYPWKPSPKFPRGYPDQYWWQVQAEMACTGLYYSKLAVLHGGGFDVKYYGVERDEDAITRMRAEVDLAWEEIEKRRGER